MNGKLSTKDVKTGGGTPKTLSPGNTTAKINSVELEEFKFKPGGYNLILHLEGEPKPGFEGFMIDKSRPELGKHAGQVGKVKASEWAYADGTTKSGIEVSRDRDILRFIKNLCLELGEKGTKWFEEADEQHATIESFVIAFNNDAPFKGEFLEWCLAGKEYEDKNGYKKHELFLPKFVKGGVPFKSKTSAKHVISFDPSEHIKKKETKTVENFSGEAPTEGMKVPKETTKDFEL